MTAKSPPPPDHAPAPGRPDSPAGDVPAQPAATVMLARDTPAGPEVLMLRRTAAAAFAAGMYVFPGGRVDPADGAPTLTPFCTGLDDATASARLGIEQGGLAYWVAAVRECFEEAGVLLATGRDGGAPRLEGGDRRAVHAGTLSMEALCRRRDLVLDLGALRYVAHWVTPVGEGTRRFDTRFFLAAAPPGQQGGHDDAELVDSEWIRPAEAIARAAAGELVMMPPTIANLHAVAAHATVGAALAAADAAPPPARIQPRIRRGADGRVAGVALPGDADYADLV